MILSAPRLFTGAEFTGPGALRIEDGMIVELLPASDGPVHGFISPGLIDLHNNGAFGIDCATATPAGWDSYITQLAAHGVTSVAPTVITASIPDLHKAAAGMAEAMSRHPAILGLHLEGPFLAPEKRGAHQGEFLLHPTPEHLANLLTPAFLKILRILTLAPELPGALAAIQRLAAANIAVSLGHTNATATQMEEAAAAGARLVTHVFNAQSPLSHRAPGAPGVALTDERLHPCLIADGIHVDPTILKLAFAGCDRAIAVTDSILLAGLEDGATRNFGGAPAVLSQGAARRADGTLAGADITLDEGIRRLIAAGVPVETAFAAATSRPAAVLGLKDRGIIAAGARADLIWWSDDFQILQVWSAGTPNLPARIPAAPLDDLETRPALEIVERFLAQEATAQQALKTQAPQLARLAEAVAEKLRAGGRLFYAGAGTSGRLAVLDAAECGPTFGIDPGLIIPLLAGGPGAFLHAAEGAEDDSAAAITALQSHGFSPDDTLVAIAASGATPFTLAALRHAAATGALTGAITNTPGSPLAAEAQIAITIHSGPEIIAGSTRLSAGTTQKIALNILSTTIMMRLNKTYGPFMVDMRASNAKLRRRALAMTIAISGAPEPEAAAALAACNQHVKTAIVMLKHGLDASAAALALRRANFSLRRALQAPN